MWKHVIQKYTYKGELLQVFGSEGSAIGQLCFSYIIEIDDDGNILIAGNRNKKIDILKRDDSFVSLNIPGLYENPTCVRVFDNKLFVMHYKEPLQVFKIKW